MNTLVIHPDDITTDFLYFIYENKDYDIVNFQIEPTILKKLIQEYDRVIMLGHGTPDGLLGYGGFVIDESFVDVLKEKGQNCVGVWCNADMFFKKNNLKGFFTGMIVSEIYEANFVRCKTTPEELLFSNELFAECLRNCIDKLPEIMLNYMKENYFSETNEVIQYNMQRVYYL